MIEAITWLDIFEHNYHPRICRYNEEVTILFTPIPTQNPGFDHDDSTRPP